MGSNLGYWVKIHCDSKIILIHMFGENTTIPALDLLCFAPVECGECDKGDRFNHRPELLFL